MADKPKPSLVWRKEHDVGDVKIEEPRQVNPGELRGLVRKYAGVADPRSGEGLAVLFKGPQGYRCEIYALDVNDKTTIDHETRHCLGWVHPKR